jgi:hypothetical protein
VGSFCGRAPGSPKRACVRGATKSNVKIFKLSVIAEADRVDGKNFLTKLQDAMWIPLSA